MNLQSGQIASGNPLIIIERALVSGDTRTSIRVSGYTDLVTLTLSSNIPTPMTGNLWTVVRDKVTAELSVRYPYANYNTSNAVTRLQEMITDYKVSICSGTWVGFKFPRLISEGAPVGHEKAAKTRLIYDTGYLL